jgi:hypothetical protein
MGNACWICFHPRFATFFVMLREIVVTAGGYRAEKDN